MSGTYTVLKERGSLGSKNMNVYVYADTSNELSAITSGGKVATALESALNQVYDFGGIDYCKLSKFNHEDHNYINSDESTYVADFDGFLEDGSKYGNGSDEDNLESRKGVHLFIHSYGCNVNNASAEPHDSKCGTGFSAGVKAWSGVNCDASDIEETSAIQEAFHCFIHWGNQTVYDLTNTPSSEEGDHLREHALGMIKKQSSDNITPLLAYHEYEYRGIGECKNTTDRTPYKWSTQLTYCTKKAIQATANAATDC
ncbi:hypothetical protein [Halosimplex halobium]|uniref:hypothetical protein n=1 Tax=Halosimplex halobium TaxID=3396618 RepID=UPI003F5474BE